MRDWSAERAAAEAGATLLRDAPASQSPGPAGVSIDSRALAEGELFVGLVGARVDGGVHAGEALERGAWGVLVAREHGQATLAAHASGAVLVHDDPLAALQALAHGWRVELGRCGARVVAITGSTGKTSTKDILAEILAARMTTWASPQNLNTEIGLPLAVLAATGAATRALVLELAMRGAGQIAELTRIAEPEVGVIVNVGEAHLEQLGSREAIAAAKAELIAEMAPGTTVIVPAGEPLLEPLLRADQRNVTFGPGGEVTLLLDGERDGSGADSSESERGGSVRILTGERELVLRPNFDQAHNLRNLLAAVAAADALGVTPTGTLDVTFSAMRGQREHLPGGVVLIDDCYNANPMSVRAALDELARTPAARRVAVLGDMLELGEEGPALHRDVARHAAQTGVSVLVTVGPLAREMAGAFAGEVRTLPDARAAAALLPELLQDGDAVLLKASRGVGLERAAEALRRAQGRELELPGKR